MFPHNPAGFGWQLERAAAGVVTRAWKAAEKVDAAQHLCREGACVIRKLCGLTILLVLLGAGAASAQTIYGSAYSGSGGLATLYLISPTTGAATLIVPIGPSFPQVGALAFGPDGKLYGVGFTGETSVLLTINTTTGAGTLVGDTGISDHFQDIAFRPSDGTLFGYAAGNIYTINTTGVATPVGPTGQVPPPFPDGDALAFSATNVLYTANEITLDSINQSTGAAALVVALSYDPAFGVGEARANGMKFDPSTGTLYASVVAGGSFHGGGSIPGPWSLGTINISTGVVTPIGLTVAGLDAIAIQSTPTTPIPALSSFGQALFVVVVFPSGLLFLRRRLSSAG